VFCRLFGDTIEKLIEEERRLFHVAVTRARETLILVTEADNISPFLETGLVNDGVSELHWKEFPPPPLRPARIVIEVGNQPDSRGTLAIREALQAEGFRWVSAGWECWAKSYPAERFLLRGFIETATWASQATGIEVRLCEDAGAVLRRYAINQGQWAEIAG
jgi:DNA helicase-4